MKKSIKKLLLAVFVMVATVILVPSTDVKAYGLTQSNPAKNSITVSWEAEEEVFNYKVYVGEDYNSATLYATLPATTTSVIIKNLPAGCEKYVMVTYAYKYTYGGDIQEFTVGSDKFKTIPDKIQNVRQEKWWYFAERIGVIWDEQKAVDTYEYVIYKNNGKKFESGTTNTSNFYNSKDVSNTMVYKVKVRGTATICGQTYTTSWSSYGYCFTQPRVKSVKTYDGKLTIKWAKINGATSYDVYVSTKKKSGYKKVKTVGKSKSSVTIKKFKGKKIKMSKKYYVYVAAAKKVGKKRYDSGRVYYWNSKNANFGYFDM